MLTGQNKLLEACRQFVQAHWRNTQPGRFTEFRTCTGEALAQFEEALRLAQAEGQPQEDATPSATTP